MAKPLAEWVESDVGEARSQPLGWLSHHYFFRDPPRPSYCDASLFFSPADGVILYQRTVDPDAPLVELKGMNYTLRDALRDPSFDRRCLVIGIFMTFFDVHVNRIPYTGRLSYRSLPPVDTYNHPMLEVERGLLDELRVPQPDGYLRHNQRVVNRVTPADFPEPYYVLQIADYDVDCITPFRIEQREPFQQGDRFSMIRFGSQVDLIIPVTARHELVPLQEPGMHVEAGIDPLVKIEEKELGDA